MFSKHFAQRFFAPRTLQTLTIIPPLRTPSPLSARRISSTIAPSEPTPTRPNASPATPTSKRTTISLTIVDGAGTTHTITLPASTLDDMSFTLLDVASTNNIYVEAACGGSCSCTTCHMVITEGWEAAGKAEESETELLEELKERRTERSRLGCQVKVGKALDGAVVRIPQAEA